MGKITTWHGYNSWNGDLNIREPKRFLYMFSRNMSFVTMQHMRFIYVVKHTSRKL